MPCWPRFFRCNIVRSSGPVAVEFLKDRIALSTALWSKGWMDGSSLWRLWRLRMIRRVRGSLWCVTILVNCLVKRFAMAACLVQVLEVPSVDRKVIGWLGGGRMFLPDREPSRVQKRFGLVRGERERTFFFHLERADSIVR